MTPEQADLLLNAIKDYADCSDLRMYAWARRRELQEKHAPTRAIQYASRVEKSMTTFAEGAYKEVRELVLAVANGKSPKIGIEDDTAISEFHTKLNKQTEKALKQLLAEGMEEPVLALSAAAGFVVSDWRDIVEPWHYFFTDAQMSWMSVITTRDVLPFFDVENNRIDPRIKVTITDPNREVLPKTSAKDAFGPAWQEIASRISGRIADDVQRDVHPAGFIYHAGLICPRWWGCYGWEEIAEKAAAELELGPRQTDLLIGAPYKLSFRTWERVIKIIHEN